MEKQQKVKRILAWIGVIILAGMYLLTFLLAIFDMSASATMFRVAFGCTFAVPIMLYAYMLVYKWTHKKNDPET